MRRIYLYGLASAKESYRVIWHEYLEGDEITVKNKKRTAAWMRLNHPSIEQIYEIDMRPGLADAYMKAKRKNTVESNVIFKVLLEREGLVVPV